MSAWNILGIDATNDISSIKKAYACKLKIYHPEDDPQGYQKLREAYDTAVKYAKHNKAKDENTHTPLSGPDNGNNTEQPKPNAETLSKFTFINNLPDNTNSINYSHTPPKINFNETFIKDTVINTEQLINDFLDKLKALYDDFFCRIDETKWEELLNSDIMWNLNIKETLFYNIIGFLIENHQLPHTIWVLLDKNFCINEQKEYLYEKFPKKSIYHILEYINKPQELNFDCFNLNANIDYNAYLDYREKAFNAINNHKYDAGKAYLDKAYEIYTDDISLLNLFVKYYSHTDDTESTIIYLSHIIGLNLSDYNTRFKRAVLYLKTKDNRAIEDLDFICPYYKTNLDKLLLIGKSYFKLNEIHKAKDLFILLLKQNPRNIEANKYLKKILKFYKYRFYKDRKDVALKNNILNIYDYYGFSKIHKFISIAVKPYIRLIDPLFILLTFFIVFLPFKTLSSAGFNISVKNILLYYMEYGQTITINSPDELENVLPSCQVKINFSDEDYTDLYQINVPNSKKNTKEIKYITYSDLQNYGLDYSSQKKVWFGIIGSKKLIFTITDNNLDIIDKSAVMFKGTVCNIGSSNLVNLVNNNYKEINPNSALTQPFITNKYLDVEMEDKSPNPAIIILAIIWLIIFLIRIPLYLLE